MLIAYRTGRYRCLRCGEYELTIPITRELPAAEKCPKCRNTTRLLEQCRGMSPNPTFGRTAHHGSIEMRILDSLMGGDTLGNPEHKGRDRNRDRSKGGDRRQAARCHACDRETFRRSDNADRASDRLTRETGQAHRRDKCPHGNGYHVFTEEVTAHHRGEEFVTPQFIQEESNE